MRSWKGLKTGNWRYRLRSGQVPCLSSQVRCWNNAGGREGLEIPGIGGLMHTPIASQELKARNIAGENWTRLILKITPEGGGAQEQLLLSVVSVRILHALHLILLAPLGSRPVLRETNFPSNNRSPQYHPHRWCCSVNPACRP